MFHVEQPRFESGLIGLNADVSRTRRNSTSSWGLQAGLQRFPGSREQGPTSASSCAAQNARRASREKGEKLLAICVDGLAAILRDEKLWS